MWHIEIAISKTFLVSCRLAKDETQYVLQTLVIPYTLILKENPWLKLIILRSWNYFTACEVELLSTVRGKQECFLSFFLFQSTLPTILLNYPFQPPSQPTNLYERKNQINDAFDLFTLLLKILHPHCICLFVTNINSGQKGHRVGTAVLTQYIMIW